MENLLFIANTVLPVFLIVFLGIFLRKIGLVNDNFVNLSSRIVFNVSLPVLVFLELSRLDADAVFEFDQIFFIYGGTIFSFILSWALSKPLIQDGRDRSVFIQGSFRGNYAIIGLALVANLLGESSLGKASILLAFILPLYNVLAVIALTVPMRHERSTSMSHAFWEIAKNPLIIAVIISLPFVYFKISIHPILSKTAGYLSALTLPMALIGIGGALNFDDVRRVSKMAFSASILKIIVTPLVLTYAAYRFNYSGADIGMMFILFACPTAIVSFVMAEAMGGNSKLAGNIILISTLGSVVTISAGLYILKSAHLI